MAKTIVCPIYCGCFQIIYPDIFALHKLETVLRSQSRIILVEP
jgi:hypothetical protein